MKIFLDGWLRCEFVQPSGGRVRSGLDDFRPQCAVCEAVRESLKFVDTETSRHDHTDCLHELLERPDAVETMLLNLGGSTYNGALNEANEAGRPLAVALGITVVMQRHHSTGVTVTTEYQTVKL